MSQLTWVRKFKTLIPDIFILIWSDRFFLSFLLFSWDWCYWNEHVTQLEVIIFSCSPLIYFLVVYLNCFSSLSPGVTLSANFLTDRVTPRDLPGVVMGLLKEKEMQSELWLPRIHRWNNDIILDSCSGLKFIHTAFFFRSVKSSTDNTMFFCIGGE